MTQQAVLYDTAGNNLLGVAPGNAGNVLTSTGTGWASSAPSGGGGSETVTRTSSTAVTLVTGTTSITDYVYIGSTAAVFTLPPVSGNSGKRINIENAATAPAGVITVNRAGTDNIWFLSAITSITVNQGGSLLLLCDGTNWQVLSTDLANDSVGVLPVVNGGTGSSVGNLKPATGTVVSSATPAINTDTVNVFTITALAAAITGFTVSGSPVVGQRLLIGIKDNGTARAITWGTSFVSSGVATLLATTVAGKQHWVGLVYDGAHWVCLAVDATGY